MESYTHVSPWPKRTVRRDPASYAIAMPYIGSGWTAGDMFVHAFAPKSYTQVSAAGPHRSYPGCFWHPPKRTTRSAAESYARPSPQRRGGLTAGARSVHVFEV
ncbi:MAG: hypothetical protein A3K65_01930 [Euryarchaeota archaeon RBG_16_68_12]|nr:MAG: hypothetical protein A3K65_01930 [Euryarchaeota archaeon RBG_16_68_12]